MPVYTKLYGAFFIIVCLCLWAISRIGTTNKLSFRAPIMRVFLLLTSLAFFMYSGTVFIPVLFYEALITYLSGIIKPKSRAAFIIFTILQLIPLLVFRILSFDSTEFIQPLGISFFTLQAFSYNYSVNIENMEPEKDFITVFLFVSFFPTISSGPIMRAKTLIPQLKDIRPYDYYRVTDGLKLYCFGLFKKLVLGDNLALLIQSIQSEAANTPNHGTALLFSAILYSLQLYLDFSGYSDIVTGCAKVMGFELTRNFDHPYLSKTVGEFWRRWHISLSSFLRDYIYFPLGGSRSGFTRTLINTLIVFLVSGLWHGAGTTFIIWGLLHGAFICIERIIKKYIPTYKGSTLLTFIAVSFAWIFFAAPSVSEACATISSFAHIPSEIKLLLTGDMISISELLLITDSIRNLPAIFFCLAVFIVISIYTKKRDGLAHIRSLPPIIRWAAYYTIILTILLFAATESVNFIYNRF